MNRTEPRSYGLPFPPSIEKRIFAAPAANDSLFESPESAIQAGEQAFEAGETP